MDLYDTFSDLTFPAALASLREQYGEQEAVIAPEGRATFAEFAERCDAIAGILSAAGLRPGDRIGILLPNGLRWLAATVGAQQAGLVAVPINTWYRATELAHVIGTAGLRMVVTDRHIFGREILTDLADAGFGAVHQPSRVDATGDGYLGILLWPADQDLPPGALQGPAPEVVVTRDDVALILFTSGSTGMPKAVPLRHGPLFRNGREVARRMRMRAGDRLWIATPFFFGFGCENALPAAWTHGVTLCLQERVDGDAALRMIEQERCTVYYGLATTTRTLLAAPSYGSRDLSSLRTGMVGLGQAEGVRAYGLTETYGFVTTTDADDPAGVARSSYGRPLPTQQVRIVDDQNAPCPAGVVGQVELRGCVMDGYLDAAELNAATFTTDGWFRTGDLGSLDNEGRFHFVGRWKEMMKINGIRVAPAEVETILAEHPDIDQVHVTGMTDATGEERIGCAVVPVKPLGGAADEADLITRLTAHVRDRSASYKVPAHFLILEADAVPVTDTGKFSRRALRSLFESRTQRTPREQG